MGFHKLFNCPALLNSLQTAMSDSSGQSDRIVLWGDFKVPLQARLPDSTSPTSSASQAANDTIQRWPESFRRLSEIVILANDAKAKGNSQEVLTTNRFCLMVHWSRCL